MKIAMILPVNEDETIGDDMSSGYLLRKLSSELRKNGMEVTTISLRDGLRDSECIPNNMGKVTIKANSFLSSEGFLAMADLFERGEQYELIHNHCGFLPLTYSELTSTPMLTSIYSPVPPDELTIYKKYNHRTFYVTSSQSLRNPELDYIANIDHTRKDSNSMEELVNSYIRVYEKIIDQTRREDHRPWGFFEILADSPDHKVKRITVYPGQRLSYQRHHKRSEHWYILFGEAIVTKNGVDIPLASGQSIELPVKTWHRICNPGKINMVFIEIQTGQYFGEDDIERSQDDYGRILM